MSALPHAEYEVQLLRAIDEAMERAQGADANAQADLINEFENLASAYVGTTHTISTRSGGAACKAALTAIGIEPGDTVVVSPFVGLSTSAPLKEIGANVIQVDCDSLGNISVDALRNYLHDDVMAVVVSHQFGTPAQIEQVNELAQRYGFIVIEDIAMSFGAMLNGERVGSFGDVAVCSFFPNKPFGTLADGGAVFTSSGELAASVRSAVQSYSVTDNLAMGDRHLGIDPLQAAVLTAKLPFVDIARDRRYSQAQAYEQGLSGLDDMILPTISDSSSQSFATYVVHSSHSGQLERVIGESGIDDILRVTKITDRDTTLRWSSADDLANAEKFATTALSLPIGTARKKSEIERIMAACHDLLGHGIERRLTD